MKKEEHNADNSGAKHNFICIFVFFISRILYMSYSVYSIFCIFRIFYFPYFECKLHLIAKFYYVTYFVK